MESTEGDAQESRSGIASKPARVPLMLGALALGLGIFGGVFWGVPAYDRFQLGQEYEQAIESDDLVRAEAVVAEMVESHPQHGPFLSLPDEISTLIASKEAFGLATQAFESESFPEALEQLALVEETDVERFMRAIQLEAQVVEAFEGSLEQEVDRLLREDQGFGALQVVDDAREVLPESQEFEQLRLQVLNSISEQTATELEGLIAQGRPIPAARLWAETAAALGSDEALFADATAEFLEQLESIKADALEAMHAWEGPGSGGAVRLDDIASLDFTATEESFFGNSPTEFKLSIVYNPDGSFPTFLTISAFSIYGPADLNAIYADVDAERINLNMVDGCSVTNFDGFSDVICDRSVTPGDVPNLLSIIEAEEATIVLEGPSGSTNIPLRKVDQEGLERTMLAYLAVTSEPDALW